ncbi:MAG: hypothetical protein Fur007_01540 [Rhodoferax sp.]
MSSAPTRHQVLREATLAAHRRLDHHPVLTGLLRAPVKAHALWLALRALQEPQRQLEALPEGWVARGWLAARWSALQADLADVAKLIAQPLGIPSASTASAALSAPPPWPTTPEHQDAAGYLLMGSMMGARVIHAHVLRHGTPGLPLRFFAPTAQPVAPQALQWLAHAAPHTAQWDATVSAALSGFAWIHAWLDAAWAAQSS